MERFLFYIAEVATKTLLASFVILTLLCCLCGHPRGAIVMRSVTLAILIISVILKELYSVIVSTVHNMTKDNRYCVACGIPQVVMEHPKAIPQAMNTKNTNPPMDIVVTTVKNCNAPIVPNGEEENTPVISTSPENVQDTKTTETNTRVDYELMSNIKRRVVKFNVVVAPPKNIQKRIDWIINSLRDHNLQTKCKDMRQIITDEDFPWISNYLVMEHISNKPQLHTLYLKFLDCLSIKSLNLLIKADTVMNIKVLLKRDKTRVNSSFRKLLNNLGHWLGMITLTKNKSIVPVIGNLEALIFKAYNKGGDELLFTVEFVIKVLESAANSKVFHAKSPWTMIILNCLAELHQKPNLRLVLKVNIELLCKKLNIDLKDLPKAIPQAMNTKNSNPPMDIVVTTVKNCNAPIVPNGEIENTPVISTSPENVQDTKTTETNTRVDYELMSNIKRRVVKFNVVVAPPKNIQKRIDWIINSLRDHNLQTKCKDMRQIITDEDFPWISNYLVMEHISNKPQLHTLYLKFLDCLSIKSLNLLIKADTVMNIKVLLKRDKTRVNYSFGKLLNNLGHWLGMITLTKNKSIVPVIGNLEALIFKAYNKGDDELLFTVEFVIKVLESAANSKVFHAKCPWTMIILNCLAELHQKPNLRLVLKVKIELLCKKLNIDLKDLKPKSMLRKPEIEKD